MPAKPKHRPAEPRLSRTRRPPELPVADWQAALRRQFGREQAFGLENLGDEPVFSEFRVHNPVSGSRYRVAIHGRRDVSISSGGDATVEAAGDLETFARAQHHTANLGNVNIRANDDVRLNGERVRMNC